MGINRASLAQMRMGGFTVIELMVTVAVLAIVLGLAIPSFTGLINANRLSTAANEMVTTLQLARMESIRRNAPVVVCASANAEAADPDCTAGDWGQWITFVDTDNNGDAGAGEEVLRISRINPGIHVASAGPILASDDKVRFRTDGLAYASTGALLDAALTVCIPTRLPPQNTREVGMKFGSSVYVEHPDVSDEDCSG